MCEYACSSYAPCYDLLPTLTFPCNLFNLLLLLVDGDVARLEQQHSLVVDAIRAELAEIAAECEVLMGEKEALAQQLQRVLTGNRKNDSSLLRTLSSSSS